MTSVSVLTAQNHQDSLIHVKGTVFDSKSDPVKKAVIYVDSVKTFIKTNKRGFYIIDVPSDTKQMMAFSSKYGMVSGVLGENYVSPGELDHILTQGYQIHRTLKDSDATLYGAREQPVYLLSR